MDKHPSSAPRTGANLSDTNPGNAPGKGNSASPRLANFNRWGGRPFSLYMILAMPLVLLLAAPLFLRQGDNPRAVARALILLLVFLGVALLRALMDIVEIGHKNLCEDRDNYRDTLGEKDFIHRLGKRSEHEKTR